ncbi:hypothetical protein HHI36_023600 [Cryptolaemus montrouzieri]|uniref:Uncharacterized protein n=1 Tax=Cryptolaemus montrouzieri TaxID=559131 RepID=A0ABD2PH24_9CUCU
MLSVTVGTYSMTGTRLKKVYCFQIGFQLCSISEAMKLSNQLDSVKQEMKVLRESNVDLVRKLTFGELASVSKGSAERKEGVNNRNCSSNIPSKINMLPTNSGVASGINDGKSSASSSTSLKPESDQSDKITLSQVSNGINQAMMGVTGAGTTKSTGRKQFSALKNTSTYSKPIAWKSRSTLLTAVPRTTDINVSRLPPTTKVEDIVDFLNM